MVSGTRGADIARFIEKLRERLASLDDEWLADGILQPENILGNGSHPDVLRLTVMEIAAERNVPIVDAAIVQKIGSLKQIKANTDSVHYRRMMNLWLSLIYSPNRKSDIDVCAAAIKSLSRHTGHSTPEWRIAIFKRIPQALDALVDDKRIEEVAKRAGFITNEVLDAHLPLTTAEQDAIWDLFQYSLSLPDYVSSKALRSVGYMFALSPHHHERYFQTFEEIFSQHDTHSALIQEKIADTADMIAQGISELPHDGDRFRETKTRFVNLVKQAASGENDYVRKQLSHSIESIAVIFSDLVPLCDEILDDLRREAETSPYITIGLEIGAERAEHRRERSDQTRQTHQNTEQPGPLASGPEMVRSIKPAN